MGDVLRNKNPRDGKKGSGGQADAKVETRNRQGSVLLVVRKREERKGSCLLPSTGA